MYDELYESWKQELSTSNLAHLSGDFFVRFADYFKNLREERRMLDKHAIKTKLLENELRNSEKMLRELVLVRCNKIIDMAVGGKEISPDAVVDDERTLYSNCLLSLQDIMKLFENVRIGHLVKSDSRRRGQGMRILRFLTDVPSIVGIDLKTYGPFSNEDVASIPAGNAEILIKKRLAVEVSTVK